MVINKVWFFIWNSYVVEESLNLKLVPTSLDQVVDHENFSSHEEVFWDLHHLLHFTFHQVVNIHDSCSLGLLWVWFDVSRSKIADELVWNFSQNFFCETVWVILNFSERHELNNISRHVFVIISTKERCIISIKLVHLIEICRANTNDND